MEVLMSRLKVVAMVLVCAVLVMESSKFEVMAETTNDYVKYEESIEAEEVISEEKKISEELEEKLADMSDEESILVVIQLKDSIDINTLENSSYSAAKVDREKFEEKQNIAKTMNDIDNEIYQQELIAEYDKVKDSYNRSLVAYYTELCRTFIEENNLEKNIAESYFSPFIESVMLTKTEIYSMAENDDVEKIYYHNISFMGKNYDDINNTYRAIGGDTAINNGYKGSGIKVGIIEMHNPISSKMGSDSTNVINVRTTSGDNHTTIVAGIIKKFAPNCTIYSFGVNSEEEAIGAIETLITHYNVHVINISYGDDSDNGLYDTYSNRTDYLAYKYRIPIVVSSGNSKSYQDSLNNLCMGPNIIAVGAVESSGNSLKTAVFKYWKTEGRANSAYKEGADVKDSNAGKVVINKPDVCAPGVVTIYGISDQGTSFSTPHVTGTIVQMMSRNSGMIGKPEALKAALIASAHFKANSNGEKYGYIVNTNNLMSDLLGAGVIDSDFCYRVARNGRQATFVINSSMAETNTTYLSKQVWVDTVDKPFRVAVSWSASHYYNTGQPYCNDYDVRIYKDGEIVATSNAWTNSTTEKNTNCEVIELTKQC